MASSVRWIVLLFISVVLSTACATINNKAIDWSSSVDENILLTLADEPIFYKDSVKPVLESRCIACHGCYDAPCQLKLSSIEGIQRGASKNKVYDGRRIFSTEPSRLMIDATSKDKWRDKEFHPIINEDENTPRKNLEQSVLYKILRLKERHPQPRIGTLPETFDLALNRKQVCPTPSEFNRFEKQHPLWGMPYAMPNLSKQEYTLLVQWIAQGSPVEPAPNVSNDVNQQLIAWEFFLNQSTNKEKLLARYLYEHLFQAHIHFTGSPSRDFFRIVRSTTPTGTDIKEIPAVRPYDDPGSESFYYRLKPYHASIVAKNHVVYELSPQKMQRYTNLFLTPEYKVEALPSYDPAITSNPFKVFEAIPPNFRYRFLLDDARFFIEGFIKGPVCRGQIALNVIEDQFWVFFFNPDHYLKTGDAEFLSTFSNDLDLPSELGSTANIFAAWTKYRRKLEAYWGAKREEFVKNSKQGTLTQAMKSIWEGEGTNPNASLTIFRHFDSASVSYGLVGDYPETAWVIDYPLLERIHYLLVAGFNVYGNVGHQLNTRLYMDFLRMEGEDNFLAYLPANKRKEIRDSWYVGMRDGLDEKGDDDNQWLEKEAVIGYQSDDPQTEFYQLLENHLGAMAGSKDTLNRCRQNSNVKAKQCISEKLTIDEQKSDRAMKKIAEVSGEILQVFPDIAYVRVRKGNKNTSLVYTLVRNKAYKNISSMFIDSSDDRRDVSQDTLTVVKGLHGAYPNFFFDIQLEQVNTFAEQYTAIRNRQDYESFVELFGVRRTQPNFWEIADWFQKYSAESQPVVSGIFDLNRYNNR